MITLGLKRARHLLSTDWCGPGREPFCSIRSPGVTLNPRHPSMNVDLDSIVEAFAPLWIPTLTFDALDPRTHEAVDTFSVMGALLECDVWPDGWRALEAVVAPATSAFWRWSVVPEKATIEDIRECQRLSRLAVEELDLQSWLQEKDRTKEQVLQAFITAIARSKKTGERQ